jgi:hypothetical protein
LHGAIQRGGWGLSRPLGRRLRLQRIETALELVELLLPLHFAAA